MSCLMFNPWVQSLGWEDPLKKEMATHSSILAWEIPWTEEPGRLQSMGLPRIRHDRNYLAQHRSSTTLQVTQFHCFLWLSIVHVLYVLALPHACFIEQPVKIMCSQPYLILSFSALILSLHSSQQTDF